MGGSEGKVPDIIMLEFLEFDNTVIGILTRVCLLFDQTFTVIGICLLGYHCLNVKVFRRALIIVAFTLILARYMKSLWQVPLPPGLGKQGWAFPSGHMFNAVMLWGWMMICYRRPLFWVCGVIYLIGVGVGLVHYGYHYPMDVWGSVGFGLLALIFFKYYFHYKYIRDSEALGSLIMTAVGVVLIALIPRGFSMPTPLLGLGALLGAGISFYLMDTRRGEGLLPRSGWGKLSKFAIALVGVGVSFVIGSIITGVVGTAWGFFLEGIVMVLVCTVGVDWLWAKINKGRAFGGGMKPVSSN